MIGVGKKIRVLVVDDSLFMRAAISKLLSTDGRFEIVGQAKDGQEGYEQILALKPDVATMDFNMPRLNGAEALRKIMAERPTPVIMFSAHTQQGARETFEALAAGAVDFVAKPSGEVSADLSAIRSDLIDKLIAASSSHPRAFAPLVRPHQESMPRRMSWPPGGPRVLIIAVSTGGPAALSRVIPALPATTRFSAVVVQHMPGSFTAALAERLDGLSSVTVREAKNGDVPRAGTVFIAPGDRHLEFLDGGIIQLTNSPPVNGCRPAADVTMASAATVFGHRCMGLVMTGMGKDGAAGLGAIQKSQGVTLAQDENSCVIYGMPKAARDAGVVDEVVELERIAARLTNI